MAATLDLAGVTDALVAALEAEVENSVLWVVNGGPIAQFVINVSGMAPDLARGDGDTQLSVALIHVMPNPAYRNRSLRGPDGLVVHPAPIALDLTYALTAFSGRDYVREQQALSLALAWVAAHPIQRFASVSVPPQPIECSLTIETASLDEIARLWQSLSGALRLTALLRVGVVFLGAEPAPVEPAKSPTRMGLVVTPADLKAAAPLLLAISEPVTIATGGEPEAPLRPGETALVAGLGLAAMEKLVLTPAGGGADIDVTGWASGISASSLKLNVPLVGAPPPGSYLLRIELPPQSGPAIPVEIGAP